MADEVLVMIKVMVQAYSLISSLKTYHPTLHFTPWSLDLLIMCPISTPQRAYSPAAIRRIELIVHNAISVVPDIYSFSPESSEEFEGEMPCPRTQHLNNVPILRGEKHDICLEILHQSGFETARRELLPQFSTCSGWRWFHVGEKLKKIAMYW